MKKIDTKDMRKCQFLTTQLLKLHKRNLKALPAAAKILSKSPFSCHEK